MSYQDLIAHNNRSLLRPNNAAQNIKVDGFMSELSSLVRGRLEHADSGEKWKWIQAERKLEGFENRNNIKAYAQLRIHEGADRSELQEQIISEYLLPQETAADRTPGYDPYKSLWAQSPVMNARPLSDAVLRRIADGVPGFKVADVAYEYKTQPEHVESQLRAYMERRGLERADEVRRGMARKMRFEHSIENLPDVFFDFSPYKPRLTGEGDCVVVALAVAEDKTYSATVGAVSDIMQEGGGVRTIDFQEYLFSKRFVSEPVDPGVSLENFWNSDKINVKDSGVITVSHAGDTTHAIGFRNGKMYVPDPLTVAQLYASSEVQSVYFNTSDTEVAMARAVKLRAPATPVSIHEDVDLEALKERIIQRIMSNLSEQLSIKHIKEIV